MADYDNEMRGVLFENTRKEEGSKQPDRRGHVVIEGRKWYLSGWVQKSEKGTRYLSLRVQSEEDRDRATSGKKGSGQSRNQRADEEIPF